MEVETVARHQFDLPPATAFSSFPPSPEPPEVEAPAETEVQGIGGGPGAELTPKQDEDELPPSSAPVETEVESIVEEDRELTPTQREEEELEKVLPAAETPVVNGSLPSRRPTAEVAAGSSWPTESLVVAGRNGFVPESPVLGRPESMAATKVQKVYRSYRTRRRLADSAVVVEEFWWQAIDYARLNHSTVSFFDDRKPESAASRWSRVRLNASKVGQGLSKDAKAQKLAFQHWIEAIDPRHRYGHNLHFYYEEWCKSQAGQPFFYWLDCGEGREVDLKECPRSLLRKQCIKYLGPQERQHYEYVPLDGKIVHKQTGEFLDTDKGTEGAKWIFVVSTNRQLYAGKKKKGIFHHSSFLAGGATTAAGRFTAENGQLKKIWAYSGHYKPTEENLNSFLSFLREDGVDLDQVEVLSSSNEDYYDDSKQSQLEMVLRSYSPPNLALPTDVVKDPVAEPAVTSQGDESAEVNGAKPKYQRTLSGGLQSPRADVPQKAILERINSKRESRSYQLGHQLSRKWCSGAGPRIGCVADYPVQLRVQALEFVNLSPRLKTPSNLSY